MLKFKTFLKEGRDSSLYHGTSFDNFVNIIKNNTIKHSKPKYVTTNYDIEKNGVSLTRDFRFAKNWKSDVVLELDQRKLTHNYKIVPIDYFIFQNNDNRKKGKFAEAEELILGDIKNVKKYIIRIWIENLYSPYVQNIINKLGLYGKFHFMELSPEKYGKNDDIKEFDYAISQSKILYKGSEGLIISPQDEITYKMISKNTKWGNKIRFKEFYKNNYLIIISTDNLLLFDKRTIYNERYEPLSIKYINNEYPWIIGNVFFTESEKIKAVKRYWDNIEYIKNPSEAVQMAAVTEYIGSIKIIKNPTEKVQMYVVTQNVYTIQSIENPTEKVQMYVVTQNKDAISYINNLSPKVKKYYEENK